MTVDMSETKQVSFLRDKSGKFEIYRKVWRRREAKRPIYSLESETRNHGFVRRSLLA